MVEWKTEQNPINYPFAVSEMERRVEEIRLPPGTTIGAIARGDEVTICHHDTVIEADDHVILFLVDKKRVPEVERLFSVGATFL